MSEYEQDGVMQYFERIDHVKRNQKLQEKCKEEFTGKNYINKLTHPKQFELATE